MGRNKPARSALPPAPDDQPEQREDNPQARAVLAGILTALLVLRPLYPSEMAALTCDGLPVMIWLLALMLWALFVARGALVHVRFGSPDVAMLLLVLWHTVAALWAVAHESPRPALNMLWEWLGLAIAFFLARQALATPRQRRALAAVMVALAVVVSIYGLYQYAVELPATRAEYWQSADEKLREAGLWLPPGSPERAAFEQRLASLEPTATFALTNSLAGFLTPWTLVALAICTVFARRLRADQKLAIALTLVPLGLCLLLTKSRSAFLACLCGGAAIAAAWWIGDRTGKRVGRLAIAIGLAVALILAAIGGVVAVGGLDMEVLSEAPKSLGYRLQYWKASAAMIRDLPLLGCGPGNFQHRYTAYKLPEASEEIADPHNFLLEVWATAGTPALVALVAVGTASCLCLLRRRPAGKGGGEEDAHETGLEKQDLTAIALGAALGMLLSVPMAIMNATPIFWAVPLTGVFVGAGVLAILRPWVAWGDDSPLLWTLAAGGLLIHLLFAGGISFPGVAGSLWVLVAMALNTVRCGERSAGPRTGLVVLVAGLALTAACYVTGYQPILARGLVTKLFLGEGDARDLLLKAAAVDPWAFEPRQHLAELIHQQYSAEPFLPDTAELDNAVDEAIQRAPRSASLYHQFGTAYYDLYRRHGDRQCLAKAVRLLTSAVALYPNDCRKRADLAEAYQSAGDQAGCERQSAEALRLDRATPHADKRLTPEQRQRLSRNVHAPAARAPAPR